MGGLAWVAGEALSQSGRVTQAYLSAFPKHPFWPAGRKCGGTHALMLTRARCCARAAGGYGL